MGLSRVARWKVQMDFQAENKQGRNISVFKAWLVAKGYIQVHDIDYD